MKALPQPSPELPIEVLPPQKGMKIDPAWFQKTPEVTINNHYYMNPPPAPAAVEPPVVQPPVPPTPPAPPAAQEAPPAAPKSNPVLRYWKWILGLFLLLLIVAAIVHFAKKGTEATPLSAVEQENAELREQLAARQATPEVEATPGQTGQQIRAPRGVIDPAKPGLTVQVSGIEKYNHGAKIYSLGPVISRPDGRFQLLHVEPGTGRRKVLMYPANRDLDEIRRHMTFEKFTPPAGTLEVFDTRQDPESGHMVNVYAWRLR